MNAKTVHMTGKANPAQINSVIQKSLQIVFQKICSCAQHKSQRTMNAEPDRYL